jgi:PAS domain S-box-containing protein
MAAKKKPTKLNEELNTVNDHLQERVRGLEKTASMVTRDIAERAEAALRESEQRLAAELASMSRLQEVSTRLVQTGESTSVLLEIVDAAIALTAADLGYLQLFDPDAKALKIVVSRGFEKPFLEFFNSVEHSEAACGTALETGKRVVINDITTSPTFMGTPALDVLLAAGVRAVESTPLVNRSGQMLGILSTHYRTPRHLADRDLHVLDLLARQVADWIERTQAEQVLRESERRYRQLVQAIPVAVCTFDAQGRVTLYNQAVVALLGGEPELGKHAWCGSWRAYRPDGTPMSLEQCPLAVTLREGRSVREEVVIERPHGSRRYVLVYPEPLFDSSGQLVGTVNVVFDITERRQVEEAVAATYRHLKLAMTAARMAAWTWDPHKDVATNSENFEEIYGLSSVKGIEQGMALVHPEDRSRHRETVEYSVEHGTPYRSVFRIIRPDNGQVVWMDERAVPVTDRDGHFVALSGVVVDITERKQAEAALRESESRFRLMADAAPVMIWVSGTDKLCTWFNKPWLDFTGRPMAQELGNGWVENVHADDYDRSLNTYTTAFDAREPFSMEYRMRRHDGEYRWLLDSGVPLYGADGEFSGYIGSCIDITERRRAEGSRAAAYRHLQLAMSAGRMAAWTWDPHKDVVSTSENFREICGVSSINGREHATSLLHPEDRSRHNEIVDYALKHGTPYQSVFRLIRPDNGQVMWLDVRAVPMTDSEGRVTALSGVAIDITERKQAQQALQENEERLQAILDTAMDAIITIDHRGIIQSVNAATERMFGYTAAEIVGKNVKKLMPSPYTDAHDDYIAKYLQTGEKHIIGITREVRSRRKDGSIFAADLAVREIKHLKLFTGIHRDLTERKQLERDVVEAASLEQRRIGQDLHDSVGQELTALNILAKDLAEILPTDPAAAAELVKRVAQGLQRVQREFRAVLRGLLPVPVDIQGLMAALADLAERTGREGKVACIFDCPAPVALADNFTATHLYLIAQEAVLNALKHAQARHIRISLISDHALTLRIQDDGIGIPDSPTGIQGLGLRIMRNRAAIIGASLTIVPGQPEGTVVTCVFARTTYGEKDGAETSPRPDRR